MSPSRSRAVKVGNVVVPIYELKDGRHMVRYRERGQIIRRPYKSLAKAKLKAEEAAFRIAHGIANPMLGFRRVRVPEIVDEFLGHKKALGLSQIYLSKLEGELHSFAATFPKWLDEIDALSISKYLGGLKVGPRRRNNLRDGIVLLYRFAKKHTFLRADLITEAEKVPRVKLNLGPPKIYTPDQLQTILDYVLPEWADWVLLGAFAGIRPEEAAELNFRQHFLWTDKQIWIPAAISKTNRDRFVSINNTLLAWIGHRRDSAAQICARPLPKNRGCMFRAPLPFEWINDGLRHSFASYWQSLYRDMYRLKEEMGNSEAINRRYYYNPQPKSIAVAWFRNPGEAATNVIPISASA